MLFMSTVMGGDVGDVTRLSTRSRNTGEGCMASCSYSRTRHLRWEDIDAVIDQDQRGWWPVNGLSLSPQADPIAPNGSPRTKHPGLPDIVHSRCLLAPMNSVMSLYFIDFFQGVV